MALETSLYFFSSLLVNKEVLAGRDLRGGGRRTNLLTDLKTSNAGVSGDVVLQPSRAPTDAAAARHEPLLGGGSEGVQVGDEGEPVRDLSGLRPHGDWSGLTVSFSSWPSTDGSLTESHLGRARSHRPLYSQSGSVLWLYCTTVHLQPVTLLTTLSRKVE